MTFDRKAGHIDVVKSEVACGRCPSCFKTKAREWAVRIMHEAQENPPSCFVTLTYAEEHLPVGRNLEQKELAKWLKRLRKRVSWTRIRFFAAGEYSDPPKCRPHYHVCLFGVDFKADRYQVFKRKGKPYYRSALLEETWPWGIAVVTDLTHASAAYVAQYTLKKQYGDRAAEHYAKLGREVPEFAVMSLRDGIGTSWIEKFWKEVYEADSVVVKGKERKPPRFYDRWLEANQPEEFERVRQRRKEERRWIQKDTSPQRLEAREKIDSSRLTPRPYDSSF